MRTSITVNNDIIEQLVKDTGIKSKSKAVEAVVSEYLKSRQIKKIMKMKGKIRFDLSADEIRHYDR